MKREVKASEAIPALIGACIADIMTGFGYALGVWLVVYALGLPWS